MASDNEASCESDPNFAVICAFMEKFGGTCGLASIDFLGLQEMLENTQEVPQELIDLHIKLLRKSRKTVSNERWEKAIIKFCHGFCIQDAWEIERFGYKKARLSSKLRVLKELLELQFDYNVRFKAEINKMSAEELRSQPLGKDKQGHAYWFQNDNNCQIRVYKEDPDEETWTLVAKDRDGLVALINELNNGDSSAISDALINEEDSNSLAEKPIIDTGQVDSSSSDSNKKSAGESDNSDESKKEDSDVSDSTKKDDISEMDENARMDEEKPEKRRRESDDEERGAKKAKIEVSEAIEEATVLIEGEGGGEENECVNPIVGEEIEEDLMLFYGCGGGEDCQTGNDKDKSTNEGEGEKSEKSTVRDASDGDNFVSISDSKNCVDGDVVDGSSKEVPTSPVKSSYKLGTIIDTKTDNKFFNTIRSPTKKSRWDVETIIAKEAANCHETETVTTVVDSSIDLDEKDSENDPTTPKKSIFFFGPGCMQFKPNVSPVSVGFGQKVPQTDETNENEGQGVIPTNTKGDIGYRIGEESKSESDEASVCVQPVKDRDGKSEETPLDDQQTPIESKVDSKLDEPEETKVEEEAVTETTTKSQSNSEEIATRREDQTNNIATKGLETANVGEELTTNSEEVTGSESVAAKGEDFVTANVGEELTSNSEEVTVSESVAAEGVAVDAKSEDVETNSEETVIISEQLSEETPDTKSEDIATKGENVVLDSKSEDIETKSEGGENLIVDTNSEDIAPIGAEFATKTDHPSTKNEDSATTTVIAESTANSEDTSTKSEGEENLIVDCNSEDTAPISAEFATKTDHPSTKNEDSATKGEDVKSDSEEAATISPEFTSNNEDPSTKSEDSAATSENVETNSDETATISDKLATNSEETPRSEDPEIKSEDVASETKDVDDKSHEIVTKRDCIEDGATKIEDVSIPREEIAEMLPKPEENRVNSTEHDAESISDDELDAVEQQVVSEEDESDAVEEVEKEEISKAKTIEGEEIPEVTAALIGNEEIKSSPENDEPEPVPVIEEACVKKTAYLLGEETKEQTITLNEETKVNSINHESVIVKAVKEENDNLAAENEENGDLKEPAIAAVVKNEEEKEETTNNAKNRGRKNNVSCEDQPRILTRRTTRSSKNEETAAKTIDNKSILTEEETVKSVKKEKSPPMLRDETRVVSAKPRRGRPKKTTKEENAEADSKKMKMSQKEEDEKSEDSPPPPLIEAVTVDSSNSSDVTELPDRDPLAVSEEEEKKKPMSLANFSLDFNESPTPTPPLTRSGLRKRGRESPQNPEETEETGGKRLKKGKRNVDVKLRKSIEEQKKQELISSDDDSKVDRPDDRSEDKPVKKKVGKHKKEKNEEAGAASSDGEGETRKEPVAPKKKKKIRDKTTRLLSSLGIDPEKGLDVVGEDGPVRVRQSRRIAQLKIKEEAERRKLEEELAHEHHKKKKSKKSEDKDYKVEKKRPKHDEDEEAAEEDSADSKKKKKKKKKKKYRKFDEFNPWRSSSDSSTSDEEDEEEMGEEEEEELQYVSDHEFSPESDLEGDGEALPLKRARTARKESDVEEVDDCPCQKCGKSDHPEWILLCDMCDNGWHCSCLRPPLLVIPEGDWFCPPCQHVNLLKKLQEKLQEYDTKLNKKEIEDRRKQRLAYVGISLNNVLPAKETESVKKKKRRNSRGEEDDEDEDAEVDEDEEDEESSSGEESGSGSGSASASDSDEPIYQLRQRRQAHSYRFNDYDELINSAIQEEMDAVKGAGNQGRGKDISTIVNAEKEETKKDETEEAPLEPEPLPPVVPLEEKDKEPKPVYSDDEPIQVRKKIIGRKKHRKLNSLDISSADDDEDSDEDFKGTSSESDDDFEEDLGSEDSDDLDGGRNRRKGGDPVRRSTRARTSRYDADFIDDGDSEDEDEAPRRKKKRSIWDESESEESDRSWGRRKRKPAGKSKKPTSSSNKKKKTKKKKKDNDDSDAEVYRKKKPKIKFGMDGEDEGPGRRTRGKKINYVDALGSDSDEDRVKRPPPRIESEEEEYVADEDDDKASEEEEEEGDSGEEGKAPKVQIQSYTDARFTQLLPEGAPARREDGEGELNPIDQINRNVEMMDENEMEKMMEDEEYANKHLQMVALQLEKEKRRKEREAKAKADDSAAAAKKRGRKPKNQFFAGAIQEPIVGNVDSLIVNSENNDELSEPPGVSLPLFADLGASNEGMDDPSKKRRGKPKKSLEEAVANLGSRHETPPFGGLPTQKLPTDLSVQESNIEIAAPPQPFSQSQPTPSVITRMLQSKPGQPGYPIGAIRPKQFASMPEREEEGPTSLTMSPAPAHHGQYLQGASLRPQLSSPYRQLPPSMNHYPRGAPPPHQIRNPVPHIYHTHRPMDPSPSGGGTIAMPEHNSPGRVVSPAASSPGSNKNETPPPPYSRSPSVARFPMISTTGAGPRHLSMVAPHLQPPRANLSPYHPSMPPTYHYGGQFGQLGEEAMPPTVYQNSPYSEQFGEGQVAQENSNSKSFDEESGGEFGGLVSYFSSQREDDLES